jgi:hypothetical protein
LRETVANGIGAPDSVRITGSAQREFRVHFTDGPLAKSASVGSSMTLL